MTIGKQVSNFSCAFFGCGLDLLPLAAQVALEQGPFQRAAGRLLLQEQACWTATPLAQADSKDRQRWRRSFRKSLAQNGDFVALIDGSRMNRYVILCLNTFNLMFAKPV